MKKFWKKASAKAGFTLIELVVVIAVLAILAAVAYPAYTGYIQRANDAKVLSEVSNVVIAAQSALALNDNQDELVKIVINGDGLIEIYTNANANAALSNEAVYKDMASFIPDTEYTAKGVTLKNWKTSIAKDSTYLTTGLTWDGGKWK